MENIKQRSDFISNEGLITEGKICYTAFYCEIRYGEESRAVKLFIKRCIWLKLEAIFSSSAKAALIILLKDIIILHLLDKQTSIT